MSLRFRKRIKIAPGVTLNLGKTGVSTTLGGRGASVNVGKQGVHTNAGIPGTGLSMRTKVTGGSAGQTKSALEAKSRKGRTLWPWIAAIAVIGLIIWIV